MFRHLFAPPLACLAVVGATVAAAAAEAVVMASTAPGYEIGRVLADGEPVSLPDGASVHVLEASGRVVSLTGPFEGRLDDMPRTSTPTSITQLWTGGTISQTDLGAARSLTSPQGSLHDSLAIDLARPGRHCVVDGVVPALLAPRNTTNDTTGDVTIADRRTAAETRVAMPSAGGPVPVPRALALNGGTVLTISGIGHAPHEIEIRRIAAPADEPAALAIGLALEGCAAQAAALLDRLSDGAVPLQLHVASDRGSSYPTYERGEPVRLVLRTSRDAHLHCHLRDARGTTVPIFPSRASGGSHLEAGVALTFPGERMPLPLHAGDQAVHCFAGERDLAADLRAIGEDFVALDRDGVARLDRLLNRNAATLASAQIVLRTE